MYFQFASFASFPLRHAMSRRRSDAPSEGDVGYARDTITEHITANRSAFLDAAGFALADVVLGRQVHGETVSLVEEADRGRGQPPGFDAIPATDGLVTASPSVAPAIIVADCVPVLLYDPTQHALGVVHAGWRGTVAGIAARAVAKLTQEFGTNPADIRAGIGPSIGVCCYEVGNEVIDAWEARGVVESASAWEERQPRPHFDLSTANELLLEQAGVPAANIETARICTRCHGDDWFSHRAAMAGERPRGRMIMVAQLT